MESLATGLKQWANRYNFPPDLIVIIRGGGAVNDLAYLNDYELAALLCKRSVPIWVGIGHEKTVPSLMRSHIVRLILQVK